MDKHTRHSGVLLAGIYSLDYGFRLKARRNDVVSKTCRCDVVSYE